MSRTRLLLWFLALVPVLCACSARDLWAPDEPRYGQVAREMLASGDLLVPHANGVPYAEKPPVYWWGVVALSLPGGRVTAVTARLGGALYALGCVFLLALLVRRWFRDATLALTAAALFSSTLLIAWQGSRAGLDLPLTFWILLAVERGDRFLRSGAPLAALACGVAWAGAILVKGPLGFLFPPAALIALAWAGRRAPKITNPGWLLLVGGLVATGLAWLLPALEAGGQAYGDRLLGQIRGRATGAEGHHIRPIWYFLERGAVWSLPWTLQLLAGLVACLRFRRAPPEDRRGLAACLVVGLGGLVFLSLMATKREVYLVPLAPFCAAAAAYALHRGIAPRLLRAGSYVAVVVAGAAGIGLVGFAVAGSWLLSEQDLDPAVGDILVSGPARIAFLLAGLLLYAAAVVGHRARAEPDRVVRRMSAPLLAAMVVLMLLFLPQVDPVKSYAPAARAAEAQAPDGPIYNVGFGQGPNLLWSLDRERTETLHTMEGVRTALRAEGPPAAVVAGAKWWDTWRRRDPHGTLGVREVWRSEGRRRALVVLTAAD